MTMASQSNERNLGREMGAMLQPLARALGNVRTALLGWNEAYIRDALARHYKAQPDRL